MELAGSISAVLLAVVFAVSGSAKLLDRRGTAEAVEALGVPAPLVRPTTTVLPLVELGLAVLLLVPATGGAAGVGALLLLLVFTGVVVANLLAGRRPRCGCFGSLGSSDVSWRTVGRNVLLAAVAGLATTDRSPLSITTVLAGVLLAVAVIGGEQLLSRRAEAATERRQADELEAALAEADDHGPAPDFVLPDLDGTPVTRDGLLRAGRPVLLVALNLGCGSCKRLVPTLVRWTGEYAGQVTVVALLQVDADAVRGALGDTAGLEVLVAPDRVVADAYGLKGAPAAALIGPRGRLAAPAGLGVPGVRRLLAAALAVEDPVTGVDPGELDLSSRPEPRPTVTVQADDEASVLLDETTGASVSLDRLGILVWRCLDGRSRLEEIVADLAEVFSADPEVVAQDVLQVVRTCGEAGLLVGVRAKGRTAA